MATTINTENLGILDALKGFSINTTEKPKTKEYKLMYLWGAWIGHSSIYAESEKEAIKEADEIMKKMDNKSGFKFALIIRNRKVKVY